MCKPKPEKPMNKRVAKCVGVFLVILVILACASAGLVPSDTPALETCEVVLFEDGSWFSPDYEIGESWPPECEWEVGK